MAELAGAQVAGNSLPAGEALGQQVVALSAAVTSASRKSTQGFTRLLWVFAIFIVAVAGSGIPFCVASSSARKADRIIGICTALAGSVCLSVGVFLCQEGTNQLEAHWGSELAQRIGPAAAVATFLAMYCIEFIGHSFSQDEHLYPEVCDGQQDGSAKASPLLGPSQSSAGSKRQLLPHHHHHSLHGGRPVGCFRDDSSSLNNSGTTVPGSTLSLSQETTSPDWRVCGSNRPSEGEPERQVPSRRQSVEAELRPQGDGAVRARRKYLAVISELSQGSSTDEHGRGRGLSQAGTTSLSPGVRAARAPAADKWWRESYSSDLIPPSLTTPLLQLAPAALPAFRASKSSSVLSTSSSASFRSANSRSNKDVGLDNGESSDGTSTVNRVVSGTSPVACALTNAAWSAPQPRNSGRRHSTPVGDSHLIRSQRARFNPENRELWADSASDYGAAVQLRGRGITACHYSSSARNWRYCASFAPQSSRGGRGSPGTRRMPPPARGFPRGTNAAERMFSQSLLMVERRRRMVASWLGPIIRTCCSSPCALTCSSPRLRRSATPFLTPSHVSRRAVGETSSSDVNDGDRAGGTSKSVCCNSPCTPPFRINRLQQLRTTCPRRVNTVSGSMKLRERQSPPLRDLDGAMQAACADDPAHCYHVKGLHPPPLATAQSLALVRAFKPETVTQTALPIAAVGDYYYCGSQISCTSSSESESGAPANSLRSPCGRRLPQRRSIVARSERGWRRSGRRRRAFTVVVGPARHSGGAPPVAASAAESAVARAAPISWATVSPTSSTTATTLPDRGGLRLTDAPEPNVGLFAALPATHTVITASTAEPNVDLHEAAAVSEPGESHPKAAPREAGPESRPNEANIAPGHVRGLSLHHHHHYFQRGQEGDFVAVDLRNAEAGGAAPPETALSTVFISMLLFFFFSLHSLIEGIGLGSTNNAAAMGFGIVVHKGLAGFAVGASLLQSGLPPLQFCLAIITFALMTPLGAILGWTASSLDSEGSITGLFTSAAGGTFLFISINELIPKAFVRREASAWKLFALLGGATVVVTSEFIVQ